MRKPFIVRPTGLKGNDKLDRMKELMGVSSLNEDVKNSVVELTKLGPDGKVYGIVREGHNYFIKVTDKQSNIVTEDFNYIGGLMNKTSEAYPSYAKAIKQLNLKFMSLNEAYGKQGNYNVFEDDNLLTEHHPYSASQKLSASKGMGDGAEYIVDKAGVELSYDSKEGKDDSQFGDNLAEKDVMDEFEGVKLSESEIAIDEMLIGEDKEIEEAMLRQYHVIDTTDNDKVVSKLMDYEAAIELATKLNQTKEGHKIKPNPPYGDFTKGSRVGSVYEGDSEGVTLSEIEVTIGEVVADKGATQNIPSELTGDKIFKKLVEYLKNNPEMTDKLKDKKISLISLLKNVEKSGNLEEALVAAVKKGFIKESKKGFSIATALEKMDSIIGEDVTDKVTELLNTLTESEKKALLSTLKKKV